MEVGDREKAWGERNRVRERLRYGERERYGESAIEVLRENMNEEEPWLISVTGDISLPFLYTQSYKCSCCWYTRYTLHRAHGTHYMVHMVYTTQGTWYTLHNALKSNPPKPVPNKGFDCAPQISATLQLCWRVFVQATDCGFSD